MRPKLHSSIWNVERYSQRGAEKIYNKKGTCKWHSLWYYARKLKWFLINSMPVCSVIIFLIIYVISIPRLSYNPTYINFFRRIWLRHMIFSSRVFFYADTLYFYTDTLAKLILPEQHVLLHVYHCQIFFYKSLLLMKNFGEHVLLIVFFLVYGFLWYIACGAMDIWTQRK